jgi:hypothetical protein
MTFCLSTVCFALVASEFGLDCLPVLTLSLLPGVNTFCDLTLDGWHCTTASLFDRLFVSGSGTFGLVLVRFLSPEAELFAVLGVVEDPCLVWFPDSGILPVKDLLSTNWVDPEGCLSSKKTL